GRPPCGGEGVVGAAESGAAAAAAPPQTLGLFYAYRVPGEEHEGQPLYRGSWEGGFPHAIWVNRAGRRFGDESFYRDYLPRTRAWDGVTQTQPNFPPFLIFDGHYRAKYPLGTFPPGQPLPDARAARADALRGLAEKRGTDADGLEPTAAHSNRHAEQGQDPDFGRGSYPWAAMMTGDRERPNPNLGPLDKPPFF